MRGSLLISVALALCLDGCASGRLNQPKHVETDGVTYWIVSTGPLTKKVRIRNDSDHELRVVEVEFIDGSLNIQQTGTVPVDAWLLPGQEHSVDVTVEEAGLPAEFDVAIRWEKITRIRIEKKGVIGLPRPRPGRPTTEPLEPSESVALDDDD